MVMARARRVGDLLQKELSHIILREMKDPRIGFSTITSVKVTEDLKEAKVYISVLGTDKEKSETLKALQHASNFIRTALRSRVCLRYIPKLHFFLDETLDYVANIESLIEKSKQAGE